MGFGRNFWCKLILVGGMIAGANVLSGNISMAANLYENDVTPPSGRISIADSVTNDGVSYIDSNSAKVNIFAKDDRCLDTEIMYHISTSPISDVIAIGDDWTAYKPGAFENVTIPDGQSKIYIVFKDANGNTSISNKGANTKYTVSYEGNADGDSVLLPTGTNSTGHFGSPFMVTNKTPKREGYYFVGWSTGEDLSVANYHQGDIIPASALNGADGNISLYAVWSKTNNDAPPASDVVNVGDTVELPLDYDNVTPEDSTGTSTLTGWRVLSIDKDLDGNYSKGTINLVSAGVPFSYKHETDADASVRALTDEFLTSTMAGTGFDPTPEIEDIFDNKYVAKNDDGTVAVRALTAEDVIGVIGAENFNNGDLTTTEQVELFRVGGDYWLATESSTNAGELMFVGDTGAVGSASNATKGVRPVISLKPEVKFSGITDGGNIEIESSKVEVSFDGNGGTGSMDSVVLDSGSEYTLPSCGFTAPEYSEFAGWSVNGGATKAVGERITVADNTTLKAVWKKIQYTVTFDANGGSGAMEAVTQEAGSTYTLPANGFAAATYYEFAGWSVNGVATQAANTQITITGNTTIKAVWSKIQYTITFDANGGSGNVSNATVEAGSSYVLPECPFEPASGYMFVGWSVNDSEAQAIGTQVLVTGDITLKVVWEKDGKTIEEMIINGEIEIGDYVTYTPFTASNKYITSMTGDLYTGYSTQQTLTRTENTVWRVIKVDTTNNEVIITPTDAVNLDTGLYLEGGPGYINYKYILDDISDKLYSNTILGLTARSMMPEDLDLTISSYDQCYAYYPAETSDISDVTYNEKQYIARTNDPVTDGGYRFWEYDYAADERTQTINGKTYTYGYPTADSPVLVSSKRDRLLRGTNTEKSIEIIGPNLGWLSMSEVKANISWATFGVYKITSAAAISDTIANGPGKTYSNKNGIRPVVTLGSQFRIYGGNGKYIGWILEEPLVEGFTITFEANGGTGTIENEKIANEAVYILPENPYIAPTGYSFGGWSVNGGDSQQPGTIVRITDNTVITPVWEKIYTITFEANGGAGIMPSESVVNKSAYTLPNNSFTAPEGYNFIGWSVNGGDTQIVGTSITIMGNVILTAIWEETSHICTITFEAGDYGTGTMETVYVNPGTLYTIPACEFTPVSGWEFSRWYVYINGEYTQSTYVGAEIEITENIVLQAKFEPD